MKQYAKYVVAAGMILAPLILPMAAGAAGVSNLTNQLQNVGGTGYGTAGAAPTDLLTLIGTIINVLLGFLGVIFLLLTIYAGFLWMTAQGNEEKVEKATGILKTAIIGLVIILAAYSIANFVVSQVSNATGTG